MCANADKNYRFFKSPSILIQIAIAISAISFGITACNSDSVVDNSQSTGKRTNGTILTANPFEYFGQQHNLMVDVLEDTLNSSNVSSPLSHRAFDSILVVRSRIAAQLSGVAPSMTNAYMDSIYTLGSKAVWRNLPGHHSHAVSVVQNSGFTTKDSIWAMRILNLIYYSNIDDYTVARLGDSIAALETQILSESWGQGEWVALSSIAIYKHSYNFWKTRVDPGTPIIATLGNEQDYVGTVRTKATVKGDMTVQGRAKAAAWLTAVVGSDVLGGICVAGAATPVGGPLAVAAGVKGGAKISGAVASVWGAVDYFGQNMGWWP